MSDIKNPDFKTAEDKSLFDIEYELGKLPNSPGVYIMHSSTGAILYVGKAVNLHNRVRQYFRSGHGHNNSPKIIKMVSQVAYFEYIITSSELEALVLECNLIKEHRPKYNTLMTDDKGYPYIRVTVEEPYPRVFMVHQMHRDKSKYFGPYTDKSAVKDIVGLLRKLYKLRRCNKKLPEQAMKDRPCLYYQIGECSGPCNLLISEEEYKENVRKAMDFLGGDYKETINSLTEEMKQYASSLNFEKAAKTRDLIESIRHIMDKQRISDVDGDDKDIIALSKNATDSVISVFFVRSGQLIGRENHHMSGDMTEADDQIIAEFIKQFYSGTPYVPKEILTEYVIPEDTLIEDYLTEISGHKVKLTRPQKGEKVKLLQLAKENASLVLSQDIERIKRKEKRTIGATMEIAEILGIEKASRMEAFDISNISGYLSVASMVVFENGEPRKNAYRKFRLRTVTGPDDYASMKEVLSRRFTDDKLGTLPDVLMMDGGKGQVNVAEAVLNSLGLEIPVCGMVKDDNHRTRGLYYKDQEVLFKRGSEAMHMITALQDETHRFAIEYHKTLRSKEQVHSLLDDIPGIGPKRRKVLMQHFKDLDAIRNASTEELAQVPDLPENAAAAVYDFFHKDDNI
ncbi:MAG: excinuclease ABC subunit UvrC [Eubacterium sp.]|nr:excinuclease ABC subunit UvrC [Eubacterium sp.]